MCVCRVPPAGERRPFPLPPTLLSLLERGVRSAADLPEDCANLDRVNVIIAPLIKKTHATSIHVSCRLLCSLTIDRRRRTAGSPHLLLQVQHEAKDGRTGNKMQMIIKHRQHQHYHRLTHSHTRTRSLSSSKRSYGGSLSVIHVSLFHLLLIGPLIHCSPCKWTPVTSHAPRCQTPLAHASDLRGT